MLGFDTMTSQTRKNIILNSKFYSDLDKNLNSNNAFSDRGKATIKELKLGVDQSRLYNNEYVQWGILRVQSNLDAASDSDSRE